MWTRRSSYVIIPLWFITLLTPFTGSAFSKTAPEDPDKLLERAIEHQRAGNFGLAKSLCRQILDDFPHYVDARNIYARMLAFENSYKEALIQYDSALAYDNTNGDARYGKGQVLAWMERYPESLSVLKPLVEEIPDNAGYLTELAKVELWSGSYDESVHHFTKAYELDTTSVDMIRWIARATMRAGRNSDAVNWYQQLLAKSPYEPEAQGEILRLSYSSTSELQFQVTSESFSEPLNQNHSIMSVEYYRQVDTWKPYARVARVSKFGSTEAQFGGGVYGPLAFGNSMFGQILISPSANVVPRLDLSMEFSEAVASRMEGAAGIRFLLFSGTQVLVLSPGATYYVSDKAWMLAKLYIARTSGGVSSLGFIVTGIYRPSSRTTFRLAGFTGDESFRATTVDEITAFQSRGVLVGAKIRIDEDFGFDGIYQFTTRSSQADSHFLGATLLLYF